MWTPYSLQLRTDLGYPKTRIRLFYSLHGFRENDFTQFFFTFLGLGDEKSLKPGWLVIGEFDIGIAPGRF